jgi:hypothetical protein
MGGGAVRLQSHGTIRTVHTTPPPIYKLGAENHMLQLNI